MSHITGVFNTQSEADAAAERLLNAGIKREDIARGSQDAKPTIVVRTTSDMFRAVRSALHSGHEMIEAA